MRLTFLFRARRLPQIRNDLSTALTGVHAALKKLPPPPSADPVSELHARLAGLSRDLDLLAQGAPGFAELVQAKNREDQLLKNMLYATKPHFIPFTATKAEAETRKAWESRSALSTSRDDVDALVMDLDQLQMHIKE